VRHDSDKRFIVSQDLARDPYVTHPNLITHLTQNQSSAVNSVNITAAAIIAQSINH